MQNKLITLRTVIDIVIESAEDQIDMQNILDILYEKASVLDEKIIDIEDEI